MTTAFNDFPLILCGGKYRTVSSQSTRTESIFFPQKYLEKFLSPSLYLGRVESDARSVDSRKRLRPLLRRSAYILMFCYFCLSWLDSRLLLHLNTMNCYRSMLRINRDLDSITEKTSNIAYFYALNIAELFIEFNFDFSI
jgi:hypothetical protein